VFTPDHPNAKRHDEQAVLIRIPKFTRLLVRGR